MPFLAKTGLFYSKQRQERKKQQNKQKKQKRKTKSGGFRAK